MRAIAGFLLLLLASCGPGEGGPLARSAAPGSLPDTGLVFPGERWARVEVSGELGWDEAALREVEEQAVEVGSSAGLVVHRGVIVAAWGEATERENSQSMRKSLIGGLIGMEDFRPSDVRIIDDRALSERYMGNESDFPAHLFMISARDLARYGLLYLAGGRWEELHVLDESWVRASLDGRPTDRDIEYGHLWWVDPDERWFPGPPLDVPLFFARGSRGHYTLVIPSLDLVVVNRVRTGGAGLVAQLRRLHWPAGPTTAAAEADRWELCERWATHDPLGIVGGTDS